MKLKDWLEINRNVFCERDLRFLIRDCFPSYASEVCGDFSLSSEIADDWETIKRQYMQGVPLAYLLEKEEFFGREFKVNPHVLIPRKETELVVEHAVNIIKKNNFSSLLDLCCGSGNIAVTLAKETGCAVTASDISNDALAVAVHNARRHQVDINFVCADLFSGFARNFFDVVVSNPPYVATEYIKGSLTYEPRISLDGGADGGYFLRQILGVTYNYLKKNGYLIMEIGYNQKDLVDMFVKDIDQYEIVDWIKDYDKNWRGVVLKNCQTFG